MEIQILHLLDGARAAGGLTVIIDVFRAFSLECYLFARGAQRILATGDQETARQLKKEHPDYVLIGERGGVILPGFDFGNSPSQTREADFTGKTVVHTTSAGTQGIVSASGASEIITGSLVNAKAIAAYIQERQPEQVSLVCMGVAGLTPAPEDELCGRYIRVLLTGESLDMERELQMLRQQPSATKFFDPDRQEVFPQDDYHMCVAVDSFDFVLHVSRYAPDIFLVER
jgi:2-phosphosulfolactate phosphatase